MLARLLGSARPHCSSVVLRTRPQWRRTTSVSEERVRGLIKMKSDRRARLLRPAQEGAQHTSCTRCTTAPVISATPVVMQQVWRVLAGTMCPNAWEPRPRAGHAQTRTAAACRARLRPPLLSRNARNTNRSLCLDIAQREVRALTHVQLCAPFQLPAPLPPRTFVCAPDHATQPSPPSGSTHQHRGTNAVRARDVKRPCTAVHRSPVARTRACGAQALADIVIQVC